MSNLKLTTFALCLSMTAPFAFVGCQDDSETAAGKSVERNVDPRGAQPLEEEGLGIGDEPQPEDGTEFESERSSFATSMQGRLNTLEERIQKFESNVEAMQGDARVKARESMQGLKEKREEAKLALQRAQSAAASQWLDLKMRAQKAVSELESSSNAALDSMKTTP